MLRKLVLMSVLLSFTQVDAFFPPREAIQASIEMAKKCPQHIEHIAKLMANWIQLLGKNAYVYVEAFLQVHGPEVAEKVRAILRRAGYPI